MAKKRATKKKPASPQLADRIVELKRIRAGDLKPNPENWRTHGDDQLAALSGVLGEVGIADAVLAFPADGKGKDGNFDDLMLFDGHARIERDADQVWPVIVTDLTLDEARLMLATTDPLAAMAGTDQAAIQSLLGSLSTEIAGLDSMFASIRDSEASQPASQPEPPGDFKEFDEDIETEHSCPKCGYKWSGGE